VKLLPDIPHRLLFIYSASTAHTLTHPQLPSPKPKKTRRRRRKTKNKKKEPERENPEPRIRKEPIS